MRGEVQALAQLGKGGQQNSSMGDGSFLRLRTGGLQYISVRLERPFELGLVRHALGTLFTREGHFLLVAVLGKEGNGGERLSLRGNHGFSSFLQPL